MNVLRHTTLFTIVFVLLETIKSGNISNQGEQIPSIDSITYKKDNLNRNLQAIETNPYENHKSQSEGLPNVNKSPETHIQTKPLIITPTPRLKITVKPGEVVACPRGTHWNLLNSVTRMGMCISDESSYCSQYIQKTGQCVACESGYRLTAMGDTGNLCVYYSTCVWPYIGLAICGVLAVCGGLCWCRRGRRRNTGGGPYGGIPAGGQYGGFNDTGMGQGTREAIGMEDPTWETGMVGIGNEGYGDII